MGSGSSRHEEELDLINEYQMVRTEYDQAHGEVIIYKNRFSSEEIMVKEKIYDNQELFTRQKNMAGVRSTLNRDHVFTLIYSKCKKFNISNKTTLKPKKSISSKRIKFKKA